MFKTIIISFIVILSSCQNTKQGKHNDSSKDSIVTSSHDFDDFASEKKQSHHYVIVNMSIQEEVPAYTLNCNYPHIDGLIDSLAQYRSNKCIDSLIFDWIDTFKSDAIGEYEEVQQILHDTNWVSISEETISYEIFLSTDRIISIAFGDYGMLQGAAHPASNSATLTLDLNTGDIVTLVDLFEVDSHFLDTLSRYCINDLRIQGDISKDDPIDGASPKLKNFSNFTIGKNALTIVFDEYQIAPRSFAPSGFTVEIPYSKLSSILKENGPIESVLK